MKIPKKIIDLVKNNPKNYDLVVDINDHVGSSRIHGYYIELNDGAQKEILEIMGTIKDFIPENLVPFAFDESNNVYLFDINNSEYPVFYFDFYWQYPQNIDYYSNNKNIVLDVYGLSKISDSLDSFYASFYHLNIQNTPEPKVLWQSEDTDEFKRILEQQNKKK